MQTAVAGEFSIKPELPQTPGAIPNRRVVMAPWQVRCIRGYIAAHLHTTINTVDLARVAQSGRSRLKRAFKEIFSCTPHQYVIRRRVERAQRLISISDDSLGQIASQCGFVGPSHLSNLFYKVVGERPGAWRRSHGARSATVSGRA